MFESECSCNITRLWVSSVLNFFLTHFVAVEEKMDPSWTSLRKTKWWYRLENYNVLNFYLLSFLWWSMTCISQAIVSVNAAKIILMWKWYIMKNKTILNRSSSIVCLLSLALWTAKCQSLEECHNEKHLQKAPIPDSQYVTCSIVITFSTCAGFAKWGT